MVMTKTTAPTAPSIAALLESHIMTLDEGQTRAWCGATVADDQDAVTAHEAECDDCQRELIGA